MGTYTLKHTGPEVDRALDDVTVLSETVDELAETVNNLASQAPGSSSGSGAIDCEPGKIFAYAGSGTPQGALLCNGQEVSRTTYWELFDTIGIRYGDGDGSTTFNLPNIASRTIIGESGSYELGTVGGDESHSHKYAMKSVQYYGTVASSDSDPSDGLALWDYESNSWVFGNVESVNGGTNTTNSKVTSGTQQTSAYVNNTQANTSQTSNMPPYIVMRYFITTGKAGASYGINPADYPVDRGEDGIWSWVKWASGNAECWGTLTNTLSPSGSQMGYPYWSTGWFDLPFTFANVPSVTAAANVGDQATEISYININNSSLVVEASANASGSQACEFHVMVKGKWKDSPASSGVAVGHFKEVAITGQTVSTKPSNEAFLIQHGTESASAMYAAKRTDTDTSVRFGVGSGGINHGVYSDSLGDWIIYNDGGVHSKTPKLHVTGTTDISGTADNDAPLIIGNRAGTHMAFDGNEIQVKSDGTTPATLNLMIDGGNIVFGKSGGTGTFKINNRVYGTNKVLWSGSHYMDETQTITLSEAISSQPNGIVLSWCWYQNGVAADYDWVYTFIPKYHITAQSNSGVQCDGFGIDGHMAKYLYPTDTALRGYSYNDATCEKDGVTFHNANYVLKYVIGV